MANPTLLIMSKYISTTNSCRIIHKEYVLSVPSYLTAMKRSTRLYHPKHFILPNSFTYVHQNSFYPKTLRDWNNLPSNTIELITLQSCMIWMFLLLLHLLILIILQNCNYTYECATFFSWSHQLCCLLSEMK